MQGAVSWTLDSLRAPWRIFHKLLMHVRRRRTAATNGVVFFGTTLHELTFENRKFGKDALATSTLICRGPGDAVPVLPTRDGTREWAPECASTAKDDD
jgi:hypothetical protein